MAARVDPAVFIHDVGRKLAELRKEAGLTQEALAATLHVDVKWLQRLEAGRNTTLRTLVRISNALGVPPAVLLEPPSSKTRRPRKTR